MGLPIERIVVGTNYNAIMADAITHGRYASGEVVATQSPAMDIQVASNFERLYFEATGRDDAETAGAFSKFAVTRAIDIPSQAHSDIVSLFDGICIDESATTETIRATYISAGVLIDPHTAVGIGAANETRSSAPTIVLATAHPAKFPEAVEAATGVVPVLDARHAAIMSAPEQVDRLPADAEAVKTYVRAFARKAAA